MARLIGVSALILLLTACPLTDEQIQSITVRVVGHPSTTGKGQVVSSDLPRGDIGCVIEVGQTPSGSCTQGFSDDKGTVILTAIPEPGSRFDGWSFATDTTADGIMEGCTTISSTENCILEIDYPSDNLLFSVAAQFTSLPPQVAIVSVSPDPSTIQVQQVQQLTAQVVLAPPNAPGTITYAWSSSDPLVAGVAQTAGPITNVTGKAAGTAIISATATLGASSKTGTAVVNVVNAPGNPIDVQLLATGTGKGTGVVGSSGHTGSPLSCLVTAGSASGTCGVGFQDQDGSGTVLFSANPAAGTTFGGWTGCLPGTVPTSCSLSYSSSTAVTLSVSARFDLPSLVRVIVGGTGSGNGRITSSGAVGTQIDCLSTAGSTSGTCDVSFTDQDGAGTVTLSPAASQGSEFAGWTGCPSTVGNNCHLVYDAAATFTVAGVFNLLPPPPPPPPPPILGADELLAFDSNRLSGGANLDILVLAPNGSIASPIASLAIEEEPSWSPDALQIAFSNDTDGEIYIAAADGTGLPQNFTQHSAEDQEPSWSPDGQWIAFQSARDGDFEIYIMKVDRSEIRQLTFNAVADEDPEWSPDGSKVVYTHRGTGNGDLYTVAIGGGAAPEQLTSEATVEEEPDWSPDGARIVFIRKAFGQADSFFDIWVMNADKSGTPTQLTFSAGADEDPAWSPDGTRIAFASTRSGNWDIYIMQANGSGVLQVTTHTGLDDDPAWIKKP